LQDWSKACVREETTRLFSHRDAGFFAKLLSPLIPLHVAKPLPWNDEWTRSLPQPSCGHLKNCVVRNWKKLALQSVMLPRESLRSRGVTISYQFQPVSAVGGDFLDYSSVYISAMRREKAFPQRFLERWQSERSAGYTRREFRPIKGSRRLMIRGLPARHAALQYAVFNPASREIQISSAGMPGPLHLTGKGCRLLKISGIPPGLWPCTSYEATVLRLEPGDSVLFCTDGVTDSMNLDEESFGTDRSVAICDEHLADSPTHLLQAIFWRSRVSAGEAVPTMTWLRLCSTARSDFPLQIFVKRAYVALAGRARPYGCPNSNVASAQAESGFQLTVCAPSSNNNR
jgi:hypothetical protein